MTNLRKNLLIFGALLVAGLIRLPFEKSYTANLRERSIIPEPISAENWNRMGQTGLAGTLGGLRSVIAVVWGLKAHDHFANMEWYELEKDYDLITSLDPQNPYYWNTGGWHLAYNAAAWARTNREFAPIQRDTLEREYLEKGDAFFHEGLKHLPNDIYLWSQIGNMWSSKFKRPDYPRAAKAWKEAAERGNNPRYQRRYLYTLAQIRGREFDALQYAQKLIKENPRHLLIPSFRTIYWILHSTPMLPSTISRPRIEDVFGSKETAYQDLYNYRLRVKTENFCDYSLDEDMQILINELEIPVKLNPFLNPRRLPIYSSEWKRIMGK